MLGLEKKNERKMKMRTNPSRAVHIVELNQSPTFISGLGANFCKILQKERLLMLNSDDHAHCAGAISVIRNPMGLVAKEGSDTTFGAGTVTLSVK